MKVESDNPRLLDFAVRKWILFVTWWWAREVFQLGSSNYRRTVISPADQKVFMTSGLVVVIANSGCIRENVNCIFKNHGSTTFYKPVNCGQSDWGLCRMSFHNAVNSGILVSQTYKKQLIQDDNKVIDFFCDDQ